MRTYSRIALSLAFASALAPGVAHAANDTLQPAEPTWVSEAQAAIGQGGPIWNGISETAHEALDFDEVALGDMTALLQDAAAAQMSSTRAVLAQNVAKTEKLLSYDPAAIAAIGTQASTGHAICCPSFSCAYADVVLDGTVHDHDYYTCSCCTWTDWGGGDSSDRCVGTDEQLLREAYDQITAGRPTVIHVSWSGGEHWIALIGYENATDPDHLTLSNFIALDPWDGAQLNAGSKYVLYGDGCEHVSDR